MFLSLDQKGARIQRKGLAVAEYNIALLDSWFRPLIKRMKHGRKRIHTNFFATCYRLIKVQDICFHESEGERGNRQI